MTQREKAEELRRLHAAPEPLVLVNAWDAVSARVVADAGAKAIATASWSIAASRGYGDGEQIPLDQMLDAIGIVARAVELPVSADLERGFGDAGATVARAIEAGAVGCNLEDSTADGTLEPIEEHVANVQAARAAGEAAGVPIVINARTDVFLQGGEFDDAVERARAYLAAGADVIFVPGVNDVERLEQLVIKIRGPISVFGSAAGPTLDELARLGIPRVSYGPGPLGSAMAALGRTAKTLLGGGEPPADLANRP
ncbi:isocitrate lyase/phosphoenolpyruvate mutase family protein [Solirubrobacter phytolaccae]|uniref:Isocitrate lyase/phosphoenolpyruvate mutase family protein n=1 Tax=Solirubrobacter phytolaccae TaxID=1404360 RepID=A0A9X3NB60_9ACTN|nr:isocitrate lyase/phosphoenolpyruvate mutase family protein [Solirubrobacter phytolaccae]MDA0181552.1 isocitrate lyase/phosphoenolpyruvate mutase family protein [Solirubrobacter phytolaccae]